MKFILDTNFYLHNGFFTECPWKSFLGTDDLTLLVPLTIIRELDEKKRDTRDYINKRARKVITTLHRIKEGELPNPLPCGLKVEFTLTGIDEDVNWDKLGLDKSIPDDWIIAEVLSLKNSNKYNITIVTGDLGLKLKAENFCIPVKRAPDEWMRTIHDPRDKKIKELEQLIRAKYPEIRLKEDFRIPIGIDTEIDQDLIENADMIKSSIEDEYKEKLSSIKSKVSPSFAFSSGLIGYGKYEEEVKIFFKQIDSYFVQLKKYCDCCSSTIEIPIVLENVGSVPAEDIDILLKFPEYVQVDNRPEKPRDPKFPGEPQTDLDMSIRPRALNIDTPIPSIIDSFREPTSRGPIIDKSKAEVRYWMKSLKHGCENSIKIFARFMDGHKPHIFLIDYTIHIANHPSPVKGKLKVTPINNL